MKLVNVAHLEYKAQVKSGDFLIWKDGKRWRARYLSTDKTKHFFLPSQKTLKEIKLICEYNYYWE